MGTSINSNEAKKKILFDDENEKDDVSPSSTASSSSSHDVDSSSSSSSSDDGHENISKPKTTTKAATTASNNNVNNSDMKLTVNQKYATDYQTRKEREELRQIQSERAAQGLYSDNDDGDHDNNHESSSSSSDEEEDEEGALLTPSVKLQFLKTIKALRQKKDIIYDPNRRFFDSNEMEENEDDDNDDDDDDKDRKQQQQKHKPKRFKDVIREQILEQMDEEDDEGGGGGDTLATRNSEIRPKLAYNEQQDELREAFLKESAKLDDNNGDDNDDDNETRSSNKNNKKPQKGDEWMTIKNKQRQKANSNSSKEAVARFEEEANKELEELAKMSKVEQQQQKQRQPSKDVSTTVINDTFRDPRGEIEDGEQYLFDFIKNKKWIDKTDEFGGDDGDNDSDQGSGNDDNDHNNNDDEDSLDDVDQADEFESKYNFRFEEAAAETGASGAHLSVKTYARGQTMNTLRRDDSTRKEKRQARNERKAAERKAKEEQLKRLKNAKRKELNQKLSQVKSVIGAAEDGDVDEVAIMKMLEGDYDPEQFEKAMQAAYGDDFYQKEDAEWKSDLDVRQSLKEDDDGDALVGQDDVDGGLYDVRECDDKEDPEADGDAPDYNEAEEWNEDDDDEYYDASNPEETELERKLKAKMQDELYKLDYEDIVAGMPTRFKYREVEPNDYGLTTQEILFARDGTLKEFVSLKKMAPYNETGEFHVGSKKRRKFRDQLKQDLEEEMAQEERFQESTLMVENTAATAEEEQKKNKRRRLKKGKKRANGDDDMVSTPDEGETKDNTEPSEAAEQTSELSKKRRRKKSGRKGESTPSVGANGEKTAAVVLEPEDYIEGAANLDLSNPPKDSVVRTKKKSKKSKKKRKLVDGVSNSRLAAYGL